MSGKIHIPADVKTWIYGKFAICNESATRNLSRQHAIEEPSLDYALIDSLRGQQSTYTSPSMWKVTIDANSMAKGRHWQGRWEIADIGVVLRFLDHNQRIARTKVALLQSKKLYTREVKETKVSAELPTPAPSPRKFIFDNDSKYNELNPNKDQYARIEEFESHSRIPVFYLLYNPVRSPWEISYPALSEVSLPEYDLGCKITPASSVRSLLSAQSSARPPSLGDIETAIQESDENPGTFKGWRLEEFITGPFLDCSEGRIFEDQMDLDLFNMIYARSAPIQSAISIDITNPSDWVY
ncbi:hypothetical protein Q7689_06760 [Nocardiopsis tropica]|uniref:hypothetical protein n=1 Tax=Nocardiopsis tropica TaxID=109330 RepID=UPI002E86BCBF|nr:hypothetical protein [Nocardiopsis tropica]